MTRQEIYDSILAIADHEVRSQGFLFAPQAENQLQELVYNGVFNTMTERDIHDDNKIAEAQQNMRLICRELCRRERAKHGGRIVESRTFAETRFQFCPRYPFC